MTETRSEIPAGTERARKLPDAISRQLIVIRGRSGLLFEDFNEGLVENQARFGRGTDDYVSMVKMHKNFNNSLDGANILGVREEVGKKCAVSIDGEEIEFVEAKPLVKNIWVGEHVRLLTPEEAAKWEYSGSTALEWATIEGVVPERVVRANNGYFYPATKNDIVMSGKK